MDEFLVLLQAKLDEAKSKGNVNADIKELQNQLDKLKVQVELDPKATQKLADSIGKLVNQKIVISNIGINQNNLSKTGQQIGQVISDSAEKAIGNVTSKNIGKYFRVSQSDSRQFQAEMKKLVSGWTNGKGKVTDINIQTRTSFDKDVGENIERLHQATVTYKNELDEVIKKTIAWRQIGTTTNDKGEEKILRGFVEVAGQYSKAIDAASVKTDNFVKKQKETVANMQNTLNQISSRAFDKNSSRPITSDSSLEQLNTQVAHVESAMNDLRNATSGTFDDAKIKVQEEISALKILEKQLKNADNVSTKTKGTDITSGLSIAKNDLEKFKADAKDFPQMIKIMEDLDTAISKVGDASSLNDFNDQLRVARSELAKIKSETSSVNRNEKVGINVSGLQSQIADLQRISPEIDKFETEINGVKVTVESLLTDLSKVNTQSDFSVVNSKWKAFTNSAKSAGIAITEVATKSDSLKNQVNKIQLSMDNGYGASEYQNRINAVTASLEKYGVETQEAQKLTSSLQSTFDSMKGLSGQELVIQADKLEQEFKAVKVSVEQAKLSYDKLMQPASKEKISSTLLKAQKLLDNNTKVTENVKNEWQGYVNRLSSGSDIAVKEINDINIRLKQTESSMRSIGKLGLSWTDKLKQAWEKFGGWGFATGTMMTLYDQIRKIPKEVYEIDTAMTNLYKVTDETSSKYNQFLDSSSKSAHELGRSISSLVEQTANWAKLGFSLDEAEQLAKISSIYANVGEVDNDTAVSDMVTAMKAFNIEASESITIVDKLNKLGNEYATSAAALGDGLSHSASAMATSGTDINKTLAMLTGGTEITQNASEFGNFLKVGSMRIRGMKGELEALGEEVDETVDSISKVQTQILNRTGGKVNIFDDMGNFRDYYDIMEDISEVYDDLNDPDKADLTEILFGKQRGNQGAALIQAFQSGQIQKALEATLNAEGSAMQEQERWLESLEAKIQQFEAAFQSLSSTILDSGLLKWFVDFGTGTVKVLDTIVDKLGSLGTILTGVGIFGISKNVDYLKTPVCPLYI
ncbi:phage tail tape measure protein [Thomasclavelia cocleata]|jgi:TP901 family phage tail tape measure protein|uniref:phage tail tape measure protein n=1 Tax=Thomasclavelia cocleata TaxID=69824 RepID=UPI00255B29DD|nr:phage tail tape measure protein [Thomasclavelia cocleata]